MKTLIISIIFLFPVIAFAQIIDHNQTIITDDFPSSEFSFMLSDCQDLEASIQTKIIEPLDENGNVLVEIIPKIRNIGQRNFDFDGRKYGYFLGICFLEILGKTRPRAFLTNIPNLSLAPLESYELPPDFRLIIRWNTRNEFHPSYELSFEFYKSPKLVDCNSENNIAFRRANELNSLFRRTSIIE